MLFALKLKLKVKVKLKGWRSTGNAQNDAGYSVISKGVTPIRGFKPTTASLGLESPRGNTESFYKATTYE